MLELPRQGRLPRVALISQDATVESDADPRGGHLPAAFHPGVLSPDDRSARFNPGEAGAVRRPALAAYAARP